MNTRVKTRSDYHDFDNDPSRFQALGVNRILKPLFWVLIGAVLGMSYNKKSIDSCYDLLAFSEAEKGTILATTEPQTHAVVKGNASSKA